MNIMLGFLDNILLMLVQKLVDLLQFIGFMVVILLFSLCYIGMNFLVQYLVQLWVVLVIFSLLLKWFMVMCENGLMQLVKLGGIFMVSLLFLVVIVGIEVQDIIRKLLCLLNVCRVKVLLECGVKIIGVLYCCIRCLLFMVVWLGEYLLFRVWMLMVYFLLLMVMLLVVLIFLVVMCRFFRVFLLYRVVLLLSGLVKLMLILLVWVVLLMVRVIVLVVVR